MQFIATLLSGISSFLQGVWRIASKFIWNLWTAGFLAFVYLWNDILDFAKDIWDHTMQYLESVVVPSVPSLLPVLKYLAVGNYFLPLDFIFTCLVAYLLLYISLISYGWIKSWIPGL